MLHRPDQPAMPSKYGKNRWVRALRYAGFYVEPLPLVMEPMPPRKTLMACRQGSTTSRLLRAAVCTLGSLAACSSAPDNQNPAKHATPDQPETLALSSVQPPLLLPGTTITLLGKSYVPLNVGVARLILRGTFAGSQVEVVMPANYVANDKLEAVWRGGLESGFPADEGPFQGTAVVAIEMDDGKTHVSPTLPVKLDIAPTLAPSVADIAQGVIFVNDRIRVKGDGFLLGGEEGDTVAVLEGCFRREGQSNCAPIGTAQIAAPPTSPHDRTQVAFPFVPNIAGIHPGTFNGTAVIRNRHGLAANSAAFETGPFPVEFEMTRTTIFNLTPKEASLGQYVDVEGGGFVGVGPGAHDPAMPVTTLSLIGTFTRSGTTEGTNVDVTLVTEFVNGNLVRYVVSEEDELGTKLDLRKSSGSFSGTIRPTIQCETDTLDGVPHTTSFSIQPVRQVVWISFVASYVSSLRHFGLRAVDPLVRERVFEVAARDYAGTNVDFRPEPPTDFFLYAQVELSGEDPNGYGLLGYDNTPGKDVENARLHDKIGGLNAKTLENGDPGYGGVFVESFFGFSEHPGSFAKKFEGANPFFDAIFDPFRADVGGRPVDAADLKELVIPKLRLGDECPAVDTSDRGLQIACAVWVLGSMIGSTMTHEVGHSLGLADPYGGEFHNLGDGHNRLMDSGRFRPFLERAEILGYGPSVFCDEDYAYLKKILPRDEEDPVSVRPPCW